MDYFETVLITKLNEIITNTSSDNFWIQNLISTLLGVILGTILTIISQSLGKLKCYKISFNHQFANENSYGQYVEINNGTIPSFIVVKTVLDFVNTSQRNIGIRDISIEFIEKRKSVIVRKLLDLDTCQMNGVGLCKKTFETMNIQSNTVIRKHLECDLSISEINYMPKIIKINFVFKLENNIKRKITLYNNKIPLASI